MFTLSFRMSRKKLWFIAGGILAIVLIGIILLCGKGKEPPSDPLQRVMDGSTTEERIAFLASYGWQITDGSEQVAEVKIPHQFDDVYDQYNQLQKQQQMDLAPYRGKTVQRFTYTISNYPNEDPAVANLLVYDGKVIGGDVCSTKLDGFMHGFEQGSSCINPSHKT